MSNLIRKPRTCKPYNMNSKKTHADYLELAKKSQELLSKRAEPKQVHCSHKERLGTRV